MSYQVIARKWRPQTFDEIVGQEHVTTTLKNAIATGRIGHAYLFTGIRGVGKTTAARVLAKALNCVNGPTAEPCNRCSACTEITNGSSMDVKEVDGASNRGIDSIRELREGVAFAPVRDRYKIYVIDEVHMLTNEAFNALLKTLEEPPPHVVFIFATTELHKVPATIASRCQVFEFKRIPLALLVAHLGMIVRAEGVEVEDDALRLVAREADGSLRDACSLMDQVISFAAGAVTAADVAQILRTGDRATLHRTLSAVLNEDPADALRALGEALDRGTPPRQFLRDVARFLAECLRAQLLGTEAGRETGLTEAELGEMTALAGARPPEHLATLLHLLVTAADRAADSRSPDLLAQAALVRASRLSALAAVDGMISRLEALAAGEAPARGSGPGGGTSSSYAGPGGSPGRLPVRAAGAPAAAAPRTAPASGPASASVARLGMTGTVRPAPAAAEPVAAAAPVHAPLRPAVPSPEAAAAASADKAAGDTLILHPVVDRVIATFGGQILKVKADREGPEGK
jgi:DNA polymerase-3 subunit gamma/tau